MAILLSSIVVQLKVIEALALISHVQKKLARIAVDAFVFGLTRNRIKAVLFFKQSREFANLPPKILWNPPLVLGPQAEWDTQTACPSPHKKWGISQP